MSDERKEEKLYNEKGQWIGIKVTERMSREEAAKTYRDLMHLLPPAGCTEGDKK